MMDTPFGGLSRDSNDCLYRHCLEKEEIGKTGLLNMREFLSELPRLFLDASCAILLDIVTGEINMAQLNEILPL